MKFFPLIPLLPLAFLYAGHVPVDPVEMETDMEWIEYHDGTAAWLTWDGCYRGTWFDVYQFAPGFYESWISAANVWFFHDSSYPWDVSDTMLEGWSGGPGGPEIILASSFTTAVNYAPTNVMYGTCEFFVGRYFWYVQNTCYSAGGWPSVYSDGLSPDPSAPDHSFYTDDFITWEPWNIGGPCNYLISLDWEPYWGFEQTTWASLKSSF